jgi:hypothetical protein
MASPRRARARFSLVALLVGALWVLVPALPASAATSLTVTPHTGLTDGTTVTVAGTGWVPGDQVGFCEAVAVAPASVDDCGGGNPEQGPVDATGSFSFKLTILRIIGPPVLGHLVDCADPSTPCIVAVADINDLAGTVSTVSLGFTPPPPPTVVPRSGATVAEGNSGYSSLSVFVELDNQNLDTSTVQWRTVYVPGAPGNQADPATDYTPASGTLTFPLYETLKSAQISVHADTLVEPDEYIFVQLLDPTNAVIGGFHGLVTATIVNDDHAVVIPLGGQVAEGNSGTTALSMSVILSNPSTQTITAQWRTVFVPGAPGNEADPSSDYSSASGTVTFTPGETTQTVTISVNGDTLVEPDEYLVVQFGNVVNAKIGGFYGLAFGIITNDD